ncbi:MAG: metal ABC transporter permease, partial [Phycisphaerales bacterium]
MSAANAATVLAACGALGLLAGAVGTFVVARRRALVADVAAHATLPGACLGFLASQALGVEGRPMWPILLGAALSALLAAWCVAPLARLRRLGADGATAVALAGFFGLGAVLVSLVQTHESGAQGGLRGILFGNAAGMTAADLRAILVTCALAAAVLVVLFDRLVGTAFDEAHARLAGLPVRALDLVLTMLLVATMVAGLQTVGV